MASRFVGGTRSAPLLQGPVAEPYALGKLAKYPPSSLRAGIAMRPSQAVSLLLSAGLLCTTLLAVAPSAAACSILVTPTKCATIMYDHERDLAIAKASNLQGTVSDGVAGFEGTYETTRATAEAATGDVGAWAFDAETQVVSCAPAQIPGLDYDPAPAVAGNLHYLELQQGAVQDFLAAAPASPFEATAALVDTLYGNTVWVFQSWDQHVFQPLLISTAEGVADTVTGFDTIPQLGMPDVPSGDPAADVAAQLAGAQGQLSCTSGMTLPPL